MVIFRDFNFCDYVIKTNITIKLCRITDLMSRVKYLCYQIITYVFGIYTLAKFNSAKFNVVCAVALKVLFSEDTKMDKVF